MKNNNFDYNWIGDKNVNAPYQYVKMVICIITIMVIVCGMWYWL